MFLSESMTPLGLPVVPDVKKIAHTSSGSRRCANSTSPRPASISATSAIDSVSSARPSQSASATSA